MTRRLIYRLLIDAWLLAVTAASFGAAWWCAVTIKAVMS